MNGKNQDYIEYKLPSNNIMRIHPITEYSFRIRLSPDGNFQEPSLNRSLLEETSESSLFSKMGNWIF